MFTLQERRKSRINRYFFFMLGFSPPYPMLRRANWCTTFKFVYYVYRQLSQLFINFFLFIPFFAGSSSYCCAVEHMKQRLTGEERKAADSVEWGEKKKSLFKISISYHTERWRATLTHIVCGWISHEILYCV